MSLNPGGWSWANYSPSALGRNRTCGQKIRSLLLYPLSYEGEGAVTLRDTSLPLPNLEEKQ